MGSKGTSGGPLSWDCHNLSHLADMFLRFRPTRAHPSASSFDSSPLKQILPRR